MAEPVETLCMAAADCKCDFKPLKLKRRAPLDDDIVIAMRFCGVCHSDVHIAEGAVAAVGPVKYPIVPGHELAGEVVACGKNVTKFKARGHATERQLGGRHWGGCGVLVDARLLWVPPP
jgi:uncharacterized zinc-type alcohol dehydrogenase-like protein